MQMESQVVQVSLDDIIPNRFQPRISFDEKALNELAASIKEHGIIQPLVLRKLGNKYEIIAGERRYKAATLAGLETVPAIVSNIDDNKSAEVALVENIQRKDLTPIEEAMSYKNLLDKGYLTQEQLAKKMGLSQSAVSNKLRLLNLDTKVQQALLDNKISERHARSLLKLSSAEEQRKWLDRIIKERLTVKKLDELLKKEVNVDDKENEDVPLVDTPNIEQIKEQATDINNSINKPNNDANALVAEDTMDNNNILNNDMSNANTEILNQTVPSAMPMGESSVENLDTPSVVPTPNSRFFNPLEEAPATLDNLNPFANNANFSVDQTPAPDSDVEIFDMNTNQTPAAAPIEQPTVNEPIINDSMNQVNNSFTEPVVHDPMNATVNELNPNNKFFQPIQDQSISSPLMDMNVDAAPVNPMDSVDNLMVNTSNSPAADPNKDLSLGDAINDVRKLVDDLNSKGFIVTIDEADLDASYQMNISLIK